MKLFLVILTFLFGLAALADLDEDNRYRLNHLSGPAFKAQLGNLVDQNKGQVKLNYSYARDGGAIGDISLKDKDGKAFSLPSKSIVRRVLVDVVTAPTSLGSSVLALKAQSSGDLKAPQGIASFTGLLDGISVDTALTDLKLSAAAIPKATVSGASLTGGKFNVFLEYSLSE